VQFVRDLFEAGSETTASTLYWSFLCLIHYPQVQEKLRKEILDVIGENYTVSCIVEPDLHSLRPLTFLSYAAFTLQRFFDDQERNLTFVKTDFQV